MRDNQLMIGLMMIVLVAGMLVILTLPSYFSSTHKIILSLVLIAGAGFIISAMLR